MATISSSHHQHHQPLSKINDLRVKKVKALKKNVKKIRRRAKGGHWNEEEDDVDANGPPDPSKSKSSSRYRYYNFYTWYDHVRTTPVNPVAFPHSYSCRQNTGAKEKRTVTILPKSHFAYHTDKRSHQLMFWKDSKFYTSKLIHPNLLPLLETYQDETHYYLVTANLDKPNLYQAIPLFVNHPELLDEAIVAKIIRTILTALMYCHDLGLVHGNLSYQDILVDPKATGLEKLQIVGFAFSEKLRPNRYASTHFYHDPNACCVTGMKIPKTKAEKKAEKKLEKKRKRMEKKRLKLAAKMKREQEKRDAMAKQRREQFTEDQESDELQHSENDDLNSENGSEADDGDDQDDVSGSFRYNRRNRFSVINESDMMVAAKLAAARQMPTKPIGNSEHDKFNPCASYTTIDNYDNKDTVDARIIRQAQRTPIKRNDRFAAPETRWGDTSVFEPPADMWSVGVLTYQLLARQHPFQDNDEPEERITPLHYRDLNWKKEYFASAPHLLHLSKNAKQFIQDLMQFDPAKRPTAHDAYDHDWLCTALAGPIDPELAKKHLKIFSNLVHFEADKPLKRAARAYIANNMLPEEEMEILDSAYQLMDRDKEGSISKDELRSALVKYPEALKGFHLPKPKLNQLKALAKQSLMAAKMGKFDDKPRMSRFDRVVDDVFRRVDLDGEGIIEYEEYLAAAASDEFIQKQTNLEQAFRHFDLNGDGFLDLDDLRAMFGRDKHLARSVLHRWDRKDIGKLSFHEFRAAMFE